MAGRGLIDRALRLGEGRKLKDFERAVTRINEMEPEMELLGDDELRAEADALRERARNGEPLDDLLPEAFALCREAGKRTLGQRHRVGKVDGVPLDRVGTLNRPREHGAAQRAGPSGRMARNLEAEGSAKIVDASNDGAFVVCLVWRLEQHPGGTCGKCSFQPAVAGL